MTQWTVVHYNSTFCSVLIQNKFNVREYFLIHYTLKNEVPVIERKIDLKGKRNHFELAGGPGYRGFESPTIKLQCMYEGIPREINFGLACASRRPNFKSPRVRVIGSQL